MAIKVSLRQKSITNGRKTLYLDFYPGVPNPQTGETTRREFLRMYIFANPKNPIDKQYNAEQLKIAESIRQQRENFFNKPEIYSQYEKEQLRLKENGEKSFNEYFESLADKRTGTNTDNWAAALKYLNKFNSKLKFADLNERVFEELKDFLLTVKSSRSDKTTLSQNSAVAYFNKVKATLRQSYKDGLLQTDLNARIQPIKPEETRRTFLTLEELNKLVKTPCNNDLLKRAALFSALTGLRFSDIAKMTWSELEYVAGQGYFLNFSQQKTKGIEVLPISEQAYILL
jgi:integrase